MAFPECRARLVSAGPQPLPSDPNPSSGWPCPSPCSLVGWDWMSGPRQLLLKARVWPGGPGR